MRTFRLYAYSKDGTRSLLVDRTPFTTRGKGRALAKAHELVQGVPLCCWELYEEQPDGARGSMVFNNGCPRSGGHGGSEE